MIELEKYKKLQRFVVILSVALVVLSTILVWIGCSLYKGYFAQYAPNAGVWGCEELKLTLSYEQEEKSYLEKDGETILCAQSGHPQDKYMNVYAAEEITREDGGTAYSLNALLFEFEILDFKQDYFLVCDTYGNHYTFTRLK